jgi:two-component system, LytTR family, response regulator
MPTAMPARVETADPGASCVRALIVEDEEIGRDLLRYLLRSVDGVEIVAEAATAPDAARKIAELRPDLVFMDIEIPGGNGIELLHGLAWRPFVIFVTAHAEFVLPSFAFPVIDYLLKPVQPQRLLGSVLRARERIFERRLADVAARIAAATSQLQRNLPAASPAPPAAYPEQLVIRVRRRIFWLDVADISWIEGASQYCRVHAKGDSYLLSRSLSSLEGELDPRRFFRVHRSAIVNAAHVREICSKGDGGHHLFLHGGQAVPMSRERRDVRRQLVAAIGKGA